jgi:riboflavin kinase/FMN adenylyltransferase
LAEKYLGHRITYTARVIYGKQLGRLLQIPTINLCIGKKRLIIHGIYYGYVRFAGDHKVYIAVISAGYNPTVSDLSLYKLEAHLLDFNANVYGSIATVEIVGYIRPEYEFSNLTMLREQMLNDIAFARKCL